MDTPKPKPKAEVKVNRVRISNFRSLKQVEVSLGEVTLLLGLNNAGKSSFLKALTIALNSDRKFISKSDLFIDSKGAYPSEAIITIDVEITPTSNEVSFPDVWGQEFGDNVQFTKAGNEFFAYRTVIDFSLNQVDAIINKFIIKDWDSNSADENQDVTANLSKLPLFFIDAQRDLQEDLKYAQSYFGKLASQIEYSESQKKELEKTLSALNEKSINGSGVLKHLKISLDELNRTVSSKGGGVEITPFPKKIRDLHKGLKVNFQDGESETFSLEYHGMGTRSWASLLGYKAYVNWMQKKAIDDKDLLHPILALEEPEAHLHPNAQRQVYSQLKQITGQKIISTHSPYIAPLAKLSELRVFYKEKDSTQVSDLNNILKQFKPKQITNIETQIVRQRGELFFSKLVVLFEGLTEKAALPIFAKEYWECEAFEKGISMIYCAGGHYKLYLKILEELRIPWIVFSDYDNPTVQSAVVSASKTVGIDNPANSEKFILLNESIEEYIVSQKYRLSIEDAYFEMKGPQYAQHELTKEKERVKELSDDEFKKDKAVMSWKAKIAAIWATSIVQSKDSEKRMPEKIKLLFDTIDKLL
jgi:putative ATP-dependent endonuclease of OLD family